MIKLENKIILNQNMIIEMILEIIKIIIIKGRDLEKKMNILRTDFIINFYPDFIRL